MLFSYLVFLLIMLSAANKNHGLSIVSHTCFGFSSHVDYFYLVSIDSEIWKAANLKSFTILRQANRESENCNSANYETWECFQIGTFAPLLRNLSHIMHAMKDSSCKNCYWVHQVTLKDNTGLYFQEPPSVQAVMHTVLH